MLSEACVILREVMLRGAKYAEVENALTCRRVLLCATMTDLRKVQPSYRCHSFTVTIATPWETTDAENFPVNLPSSLCCHKSRTAALR
jgi:hypothetical protein